MKKNYIFYFLFLLLIFNCRNSNIPEVKIKINNKIYTFDVAVSEKVRQKGLMFIKKLDKDNGMLFVYGKKDYLYFYMKNTYIPLDIAFLDEEFKIIDIKEMEPLDETTIPSNGKAMYALEVNRGFYKRVGLKVGDKLEFVTPISYKVEQ